MSTTPLFEIVKARTEELNAWAAAGCPGATYEDLRAISGDTSPSKAFGDALNRIARTVDLMTKGRPIKATLDETGFEGNRLPVYVASLGGIEGKRVHDVMEIN